MDISILLAKVIGPYFFIMAIVLYARMHKFKAMVNEAHSPMFVFVSGARSLLFGLLLVACHNIWEGDWRTVITVIGWLLLVRGIVRLLFPERVLKMVKKVVNHSAVFCSLVLVALVVGAYLSYMGYMG